MDHFVKEYLLRAEKITAIAELAAGVAHEINNPLGIITNYVVLLKSMQMGQEAQEHVAKIETELGRIVDTIGSLLVQRDVEPLLLVPGDENKLKQLLINLCANSIEAVLDHGAIRIGAARSGAGTEAVLTVTDNGCGIPAQIAESVFTPFFTTKMNKKNVGLGLSICQNIVESHGGTMSFESEPGSWTTFTIRLPCAR